MKPKDAANIMNDLDIEVSVMVLGTMSERNAAPILAGLNPVRARAISKIILERSKLPGDQRLNNLKLD
jgi:flagellar motility protein MotE (MotC chaperone)